MENFLIKNRKAFMVFSENLFFLILLLIFLDRFTSLSIYTLLNLNLLISLSIITAFTWFFFFIKKNEKILYKKVFLYIEHGFIIGLLLISIVFFESINNSTSTCAPINFLIQNIFLFSLVISCLGFFTLYFNRDKVEKEILCEKNREREEELKRKQEFSIKFPIINKIWLLKYIVKWFYKEGWAYSFGLSLLIFFGLWLRLRYVGQLSFWVDESTTVMVARRIASGLGQTLMSGETYNRAFIYHHYLGLFFHILPKVNVYFLSRAVNIPFFIGLMYLIYIAGKSFVNKKIGIGSAFLFCFSWIAISLFRDARFYEMWLFFFLLFLFALFKVLRIFLNYHGKYFFSKDFLNFNFGKFLFILLFFGLLSLDAQQLTFFIFYPLVLLGIILIFTRNFRLKGIFISASSFFILLISFIFVYRSSFSWSYFLKYPQPEWQFLATDFPWFDFYNFLLANNYLYLPLLLCLLTITCLVFSNKKIVLFSYIFLIGWYLIMSNQGYEAQYAIRYYYPIIPILSILAVVMVNFIYRSINKSLFSKIIFLITILIFAITIIISGFKESDSVLKNDSLNPFKNSNYIRAFDFLNNSIYFKSSKIISDNTFAMPFFLHFNKVPDFIMLNSNIWKFSANQVDPYVNVPELDYKDIDTIQGPLCVIFVYQPQRMGPEILSFFYAKGELMYKDRYRYIFYIKN